MSRRTWTYTLGGKPLESPLEVTPGAEPDGYAPQLERQPVYTDRYMEGVRATDGTDISSRRKRREYMTREGLADASDFTEHWRKARERRAAYYREGDTKGLAELVGRSAHEVRSRRGRR